MWIASVSAPALPVPSLGGRAHITQDRCGYTKTSPAQQTFPDAKCKQLSKLNHTKIPSLMVFQKGDTKGVTMSVRSVVSTPSQLCSPHCLISPTETQDFLSQRRRLPFGFLPSAQSLVLSCTAPQFEKATEAAQHWKAGNRDLNLAKLHLARQ